MIRAAGETNGKRLIIVGLAKDNIEHLQAGEPIRVTYPDGSVVLVLYGDTEEDIVQDLRSMGVTAPVREVPDDGPR